MSNPGSSADGNYSSPVPAVGLYIAAGSSACLLIMVYDVIFAGICTKKRWLPCKYFALNSVTLTLLGVAAKLTVDLTTPMPSRWDQLSKLTGTAFICVGMGFLVPSIGVNAESESLTNMMSLTIFVITVAVNICIQLATGVIFVFFVEHIIILALMFLLLLMLWHISLEIKLENRIDASQRTSLVTRGEPGLFERLKLCSVQAYCSNPQLKISRYPMNIAVGSICVACAAIIAQAALRSLLLNKMEFRAGDSDYKWWSMRCIVIIQIVTVILGPVPIIFRCVAMFNHMDFDSIYVSLLPDEHHVKQMKRTLRAKCITLRRLLNFFGSMITQVVLSAQVLMVSPWVLVRSFVRAKEEDDRLEYFGERCSAPMYFVRKSIDEMIKLKDQVSRSNPLYLPYLFKGGFTNQLYMHRMRIQEGNFRIQISTLSLVSLIKIAEASIPKHLLASLLDAFQEAREVIEYIDKAIISNTSPMESGDIEAINPRTIDRETIHKSIYASELWTGGDFACLLPRGFRPAIYDYAVAKDTIDQLGTTLHDGLVWDELVNLIKFITYQHHDTIEELYGFIEQLFVEMLKTFFAQLPRAIFHNLTNTQDEEFEDSVKVAMEILLRIGSYDAQNVWDFPGGMTCMTMGENAPREEYYHEPGGSLKRLNEIVLVWRDF